MELTNMLPLPTGVTVLILIAVVAAALVHWRIKRFFLASTISALCSVGVFFIASTLQAGIPDPLEPIALVYFFGFAFLIALAIGVLGRLTSRIRPARA